MKKIFLFMAATAMSIAASATVLWSGSKEVTWGEGNSLQIEAVKFADAQPGQKIVLTYESATDGVEFKVMNLNSDHLAGSRDEMWISGQGTLEQFLTQMAVDSLKLHGLELVGAHFTATKVELLDGKALKEGISAWTGFFWADEWSTMYLYRDAYCNVDFSTIEAVRFYSEASENNYILNLRSEWGTEQEPERGFIADKAMMTDGEGYAELLLTDELRAKLHEAGRWIVQFNKETISPFNVTDIVLVPTDSTTAISNTAMEAKSIKIIRNGQILILKGDKTYNALGVEVK